MSRSRKIINTLSGVVGIVFILCLAIFLKALLGINVLPTKYVALVLGAVGVIALILLLLLFIPKVNKVVKIITCIFALIFTGASIFGILKINDTTNFFKNIAADNFEIENYYVLVLKDSKYSAIEDIQDKKMGTFPSQIDSFANATSKLNEVVDVDAVEYDDLFKMALSLLEGKVEAILISDAHKQAIEEEYDYFSDKVKELYKIELKTELEEIVKDASVTKEPFTLYISGIDTYGPIATKSRSDVNIIMTINPKTNEIVLTSIPRDYYVQLHGTKGNKDKLTHAGVYGINMSVQTIEDLLDVEINYYARVNFNTLIDVVDIVGGLSIDSDAAFTPWTNPNCPITKGVNILDGKCTLAFARERHAYASGDRHRGQNQQQVITKLIDKLTSSKTVVRKYSEILDSLDGSFQTNIPTTDIYALIKMQLADMPKWNVNSISLDGKGSMSYTYTYPKQKLYVMVPTQSTVDKARKIISGIVAGSTYKDLTTQTTTSTTTTN